MPSPPAPLTACSETLLYANVPTVAQRTMRPSGATRLRLRRYPVRSPFHWNSRSFLLLSLTIGSAADRLAKALGAFSHVPYAPVAMAAVLAAEVGRSWRCDGGGDVHNKPRLAHLLVLRGLITTSDWSRVVQ